MVEKPVSYDLIILWEALLGIGSGQCESFGCSKVEIFFVREISRSYSLFFIRYIFLRCAHIFWITREKFLLCAYIFLWTRQKFMLCPYIFVRTRESFLLCPHIFVWTSKKFLCTRQCNVKLSINNVKPCINILILLIVWYYLIKVWQCFASYNIYLAKVWHSFASVNIYLLKVWYYLCKIWHFLHEVWHWASLFTHYFS